MALPDIARSCIGYEPMVKVIREERRRRKDLPDSWVVPNVNGGLLIHPPGSLPSRLVSPFPQSHARPRCTSGATGGRALDRKEREG